MTALGRRFLDHHLAFRPVDASFMGESGYDMHLPRADRSVAEDERRAIAALQVIAEEGAESSAGERLDKRIVVAELKLAAATLANRSRFGNPAWYSGEAIFSVVSLLLPQSAPLNVEAVTARLSALPDFLADGRARLAEAGAAPVVWSERAKREAAAFARFLTIELGRVAGASASWRAPAERAAQAMLDFAATLGALADRDPAAGAADLGLIISEVHGFDRTAEQLKKDAKAAFDRLGAELVEDASRLDPTRSWQQIIADLALITPASAATVLENFRHWHDRAIDIVEAAGLLTPETGYGLDYRLLDPAFRELAPQSYFLFYRSPPALRAGSGSVYWVSPPGDDEAAYLRGQSIATIKTTHAVHHGSIGHHTQNGRARTAPGLLGRVAGTDCALGLSLLSSGSMVEGWACYVDDLLREAGGFYSPEECLLLKQNERRNAASVLVDINLHDGSWSLNEAERFYRDEAGFPPQRVAAEVARNAMFPGSRLMYWTGVEAIRSLRRTWSGSDRQFHDRLISFGHVPIAFAATELTRQAPP